MSQITFDTLEISKRLQKAGFTPEQAEELAKVQRDANDSLVQSRELATKRDLVEMETRLTRHMFNMLLGFAAAIGAFFGIAVSFMR